MKKKNYLRMSAGIALTILTSYSWASDYESTVLLQNPAAYYRYNTTAEDSSTDPNLGYLDLSGAEFYDAYTRGVPGPDLPGFESDNKSVEYRGGYSTLPSLNLLTSEATILAWVKVPPTHPNYAGLVFNRGDGNSTTTGLDLKGADTFQLGYHWSNHSSSYSFQSALYVEPEKWNLVAMVGNEEGVRLYRGDSSGSLESVLNAVPCVETYLNGIVRVGRDLDSARILSSENNPAYIDEVAIFNYALTEEDVLSIYKTARNESYAPTRVQIVTSDPVMYEGEGSLTVLGNGSFETVEWYRDGVKLDLEGIKLINPVAGTYTAKLVNSAGSLESDPVVVLSPAKPSITVQPESTSRHPYGRVDFSVEVEGSKPISYQWKLDGVNIDGATNNVLSLRSLDRSQFGSYTVEVSNTVGSEVSESAVLTEVPVEENSFAEEVMKKSPIAFYRFDDTLNDNATELDPYGYTITGIAHDYAGGNDGLYHNLYTFNQIEGAITGDSSGSLHFDGAENYGGWISTDLQMNDYPEGFTVMGWVRMSSGYGRFTDQSAGYFGQNDVLEMGPLSDGRHGGWMSGVSPSIYAPNNFGDNVWGLFAMCYDGTAQRLYLNGELAGESFGTANFNSYQFYFNIGGGGVRSDPNVSMDFYTGDIDDVAVFDYGMTQEELMAFWSRGVYGAGSAPVIRTQPKGVCIYETMEREHTLSVLCAGTLPINYQWYKDGIAIEGATSSELNLVLNEETLGNYDVEISNNYGTIRSEVVQIEFIPIPQESSYEGIIYGMNPYAYWRLGETTGNVANERVHGRSGTYTSDNTLGQPGAIKDDEDLSTRFGGIERVIAPSMELDSVSELTLLAWIKSEGTIPHYAGVIFNRNVDSTGATGLDIAHEQVCYHWNDLHYSFRSGLYPENDVWNMVALTVSANEGTVYLGDSKGNLTSKTNYGSHPAASLIGNLQIGGDLIESRRFKGDIDEAVIFTRALSAEEIYKIYNVGLVGLNAAPRIISQPVGGSYLEEDAVVISATAVGSEPMSWQWYKDGNPIEGANSSEYHLNGYVDESGVYTVSVSNHIGTITSEEALVTISYPAHSIDLTGPKYNLWSHLKFNNSLEDSSGNGNSLFDVGSTPFMEGIIGESALNIQCDYNNWIYNYVGFNNNLIIGAKPLTVSFWIKVNSGNILNLPILCNTMNGLGDYGFTLGLGGSPSGDIACTLLSYTDNTSADLRTSLDGAFEGQWNNVVCVMIPGETLKLFVNGKSPVVMDISNVTIIEDSSEIGSLDNPSNGFFIGQSVGLVGMNPGSSMDILIDDLGIWRTALTDIEARSIYQAGLNGWSFDEIHEDKNPPTIGVQPQGLISYINSDRYYQMELNAIGAQPMQIEWFKDGESLGVGRRVLDILLTEEAAGSYYAVVSNEYGQAETDEAVIEFRIPEVGSYEELLADLNPTAYYRFEDDMSSGAVVYDYAGGYNGIYYNIVDSTQIPTGIVGDTEGQAMHFDGDTSKTSVRTGFKMNYISPNAFTVLGWVRHSLEYGPYTDWGGYFGQNDVIELGDGSDSRIGGWISGLSSSLYTANPYPDGTWGLFAVTYGNGVAKYYANDVQYGSCTGTPTFNSTEFMFCIGGGGVRGVDGDYFIGDIDEVAVFDYELTPDQIEMIYLKGSTGEIPLQPEVPVLNYVVDDGILTLTWTPNSGISLEKSLGVLGTWNEIIPETVGLYQIPIDKETDTIYFRLRVK